MIDCISCGRCGKWATATGGGICEVCVVRESRDTQITTLRAELAAAKEEGDRAGFNLADANGEIAVLSRKLEDCQATCASHEAANKHYYEKLEKALAEGRALAADNARLRKAEKLAVKAIHELTAFAERWAPAIPHEGSCGPESGCDGICVEIAWLGRTMRTVANWKKLHETIAATPAQSLAAHDAATKVAVLREVADREFDPEQSSEERWAYGVLHGNADRIAKEAANG